MHDRLVEHPVNFVAGLAASGASVFGVVTQDNALAMASAVVAVGFAVAGPVRKAFGAGRAAQREEDAKDRELELSAFQTEVRKRVELEFQVKQLTEQVAALKGFAKSSSKTVKDQGERLEAVERSTTGSSDNISAT